jgi:hypothetical protein
MPAMSTAGYASFSQMKTITLGFSSYSSGTLIDLIMEPIMSTE